MPALAYDREPAPKKMRRRRDYRPISSRPPPGANSSFRPSGKSDIDWFYADDPQFRPTRLISMPAPRRPAASAARHFRRGACRYVETSHPRPATSQRSVTIAGLFLAPRRTDHATRRVISAS
jgi:hypothetical protein